MNLSLHIPVVYITVTLILAGFVVGYVPQNSRRSIEENPCANRQIGARVNDPSSCKAYWICREDGPESALCGGIGVFHTERETCVSAADFQCVDEVEIITEPPNPCSGRESGNCVNNDESCEAFWLCTDDGAILSSCEAGYKFNTDLERCVLGAEFRCDDDDPEPIVVDPPSPCVGIEDGHFIDNPKNCQSYFLCYGNTHYEGECWDGLNFNPENQWCDWQFYCEY